MRGQKTNRLTRVDELLKREIAEVVCRRLSARWADAASVTVSHVTTSSNLRNARVLVSVRAGETAERERVLGRLRRDRVKIQREVSRRVILKYTPVLHFVLDNSLAEGDRVLGLIAELENAGQDTDPAPLRESMTETEETDA